MSHAIKVGSFEQLKEELGRHGDKQIIVDFWAEWCGPCKALSPVLDEIEQEREDVVLLKANVDENEALSEELGINSIPTLMFFRNGTTNVAPIVGAAPKNAILSRLPE